MAAIAARAALMSVAWPCMTAATATIKPAASTATTIGASATVATATAIPSASTERTLET